MNLLTLAVSKAAAAVCLAALMYWLLAIRLADALRIPGPAGKKESDYPALKRKAVSSVIIIGLHGFYWALSELE